MGLGARSAIRAPRAHYSLRAPCGVYSSASSPWSTSAPSSSLGRRSLRSRLELRARSPAAPARSRGCRGACTSRRGLLEVGLRRRGQLHLRATSRRRDERHRETQHDRREIHCSDALAHHVLRYATRYTTGHGSREDSPAWSCDLTLADGASKVTARADATLDRPSARTVADLVPADPRRERSRARRPRRSRLGTASDDDPAVAPRLRRSPASAAPGARRLPRPPRGARRPRLDRASRTIKPGRPSSASASRSTAAPAANAARRAAARAATSSARRCRSRPAACRPASSIGCAPASPAACSRRSGCGELALYLTVDDLPRRGRRAPVPHLPRRRRPRTTASGTAAAKAAAPPAKPCDAHGASTLFGATSNDCEPSAGKNVGELTIDLAPLTTGDAKLEADAQLQGRRRQGCRPLLLRRAGASRTPASAAAATRTAAARTDRSTARAAWRPIAAAAPGSGRAGLRSDRRRQR